MKKTLLSMIVALMTVLSLAACSGGGRGTTPITSRGGGGKGAINEKLKAEKSKLSANAWCIGSRNDDGEEIFERHEFLAEGVLNVKFYEMNADGSKGKLKSEALAKWTMTVDALTIEVDGQTSNYKMSITKNDDMNRLFLYSLKRDGKVDTSVPAEEYKGCD